MLVLSRKEGQRIIVGSNIEIVVTEVSGNRVKLGISAPAEVPINREEIYERMQNESSFQTTVELGTDSMHLDCVCCD